jgi:hypothetical protein
MIDTDIISMDSLKREKIFGKPLRPLQPKPENTMN